VEFEKYKSVSFTFVFGLLLITLEPFELETSFLVYGYLVWRSKSRREILGFPLPVSTLANISRSVRRGIFTFISTQKLVGVKVKLIQGLPRSNVDSRLKFQVVVQ